MIITVLISAVINLVVGHLFCRVTVQSTILILSLL